MEILKHIGPYSHVIWDWNGTVIDDVDFSLSITNALLKEHSLDSLCRDRHRELFRLPVVGYYEDLGFDFSRHDFAHICNRFVEEYERRLVEGVQLYSGVHGHLQRIKATKTQSILSAAEQGHLEAMTKHFDIAHFFDHIFGLSNNHSGSKVERGRQLIDAVNLPKSETLLIGDTDHDLEVGLELGIDVLLIADGHQSYDRLKPLHHNVLRTRY